MRRYTYIFIALIILCQLSCSVETSNRLRSGVVATVSPSWRLISNCKHVFLKLATIWPAGGYFVPPEVKRELELLRLENHNYRYQIELLKAQIDVEKLVGQQASMMSRLADDVFSKRRKEEILRRVDFYSQSMVASVIYREGSSWNSSFWINVGEKTNGNLGREVVAKNSPVVIGTSVIGVIEYVGKYQSRVRLITDASIVPAVRAIREGSLYFAKGVVQGIRHPHWQSRQTLLKGVGFNADFADEEGPSHDLRQGLVVKVGDILVTTGMDGIFPAGLRVGEIQRVYPIEEGATAYEVDVKSFVADFENISFVTVLPSIADPFL